MNALKPTFSFRLQSSTAVHSAPLWLRKAMLPVRAIAAAKVAFTPVGGIMMPRQLGPMIRMPAARAFSTSCRSSSAPSGPVSLNPAEITTAARIPASPHSLMIPGISRAGVTTTARSTSAGISFTFL